MRLRFSKILTLLGLLFFPVLAWADPTLSGPLIQSVNTDRATYTGGQSARLFVTLSNQTGSDFTGTITATVSGRGVQIGQPVSLAVTALPAAGKRRLEFRIQTDAMASWQGYFINLVATTSGGAQVDQQAAAIDSSPDWWTYPRQCWLVLYTDFGGWKPPFFTTPDNDIRSLNAYHCNNLQFYDMDYLWHQPWTDAETWVNGDKMTISASQIRQAVATTKLMGMGSLYYFAIYGANWGIAPDFTQDGSGAQLQWGMFTSACAPHCGVADLWKYNQDIAYMNPNNIEWQTYWAEQARLLRDHFGFDGFFVDTYGTIERALWDFWNNRIIMDTAYSSFLKTVSARLGAAFVLNPAGSYNEQDLVQSGMETYHFVERWNNPSDIGSFGDFLTKARQVWTWAARKIHNIGLDWDMGMNKTLMSDKTCDFNGGARVCTFNTPGVLYLEAAMLATGAHHAWIVNGDMRGNAGARFISNDDYPIGNLLSPKADMVQGEYDYQTFGVAYEKLLRLNIYATSSADPSIMSGATGSTTAAAGKVWLFQNYRSGFDILHLLNYQQMSADSFKDVSDNAANAAAPNQTGALQIKMYVGGGTLGNLYTASPDVNHGAPVQLTYTTASDAAGKYITFSLPSLLFWDMVWLEDSTGQSDYTTP